MPAARQLPRAALGGRGRVGLPEKGAASQGQFRQRGHGHEGESIRQLRASMPDVARLPFIVHSPETPSLADAVQDRRGPETCRRCRGQAVCSGRGRPNDDDLWGTLQTHHAIPVLTISSQLHAWPICPCIVENLTAWQGRFQRYVIIVRCRNTG